MTDRYPKPPCLCAGHIDRFGVKATFFMVGDNVRKYPDIYRMVVERRAPRRQPYVQPHRRLPPFERRISGECRQGQPPAYQKPLPPASRLDAIAAIQTAAQALPHHHVFGYLATTVKGQVTAEDVVNNVKRYARNGSIITFHDSLKSIDKLQTALPEALQWLKDQGYAFKVIENRE